MLKSGKNLAYLILLLIPSCIDPYVPNLKSYTPLLVIDGLITNENKSHNIILSRSYTNADSVPRKIADAIVYITENKGTRYDLRNIGDGIYKTDSTIFRGTIGHKYTLHILTADGNEYISDECPMLPVADIDTLYYVKSEEVLGTPGKSYAGLKILLDTEDLAEPDQYYRWTFEETWQVIIPYPPQYSYTIIDYDTYYFQSVPEPAPKCWKKNYSRDIIINSVLSGQGHITGQELLFITPSLSDKLTVKYTILVKQYSISEDAYNFWKMFRQVEENPGDIFGSLPYPVSANIYNISNPGETVLGFFEVAAVSQKRIFIDSYELLPLALPLFETDCEYIRLSPDMWPDNQPTWDEIYHSWVFDQHYVFVTPEANAILPGNVGSAYVKKFVFTTPVCAFCEKSGFTERPDFWVDSE